MILLVIKLNRFINAPSESDVRVTLFSALKQLLFTHSVFSKKSELEKFVEEYVPPIHLEKQQALRERYSDDSVYYLIILCLNILCCEYSTHSRKKVDDLIHIIYLLEEKQDTWLTWNGREFLFFTRR